MSNLRQAAQQALDDICGAKLCEFNSMSSRHEMVRLMDSAITALRQALAEPDSDYERGFVDGMNLQTKGSVDKAVNRKPQTTHWEGCEAVHPECRKPEQEPVAWMDIDDNGQRLTVRQWSDGNRDEVPLYTAPTPRKPLTDEEIDRVTDQQWGQDNHKPIYAAHRAYARAIERHHGIGEQT